MKKQKHKSSFERKLDSLAKIISQDLECLNALCENSERHIQRQISFVENDVHNIFGLIWAKMEKEEKK